VTALHEVAEGDPCFGILLDGRFGFDALAAAADHPYWIGRCIEVPRSRPVEFEVSADVGSELAAWPLNHVVKVLLFYHPDDEPALRERQERRCSASSTPAARPATSSSWRSSPRRTATVDASTIARAVERFYDLGVKPDWWKLEPWMTRRRGGTSRRRSPVTIPIAVA
jgi:5-dehydro-2-deoxygluconokinase